LDPGSDAQAALAELLRALNAPPKAGGKEAYRLVVANALWGQEGAAFRKEYLALVGEEYRASLRSLDFAGAAEAAAKAINSWVEEKTQAKIKDLVNAGLIRDAVLVLTNAIYFKSEWQSQFLKSGTTEMPFHLAAGGTAPVPMMHQLHRFGYLKGEGF